MITTRSQIRENLVSEIEFEIIDWKACNITRLDLADSKEFIGQTTEGLQEATIFKEWHRVMPIISLTVSYSQKRKAKLADVLITNPFLAPYTCSVPIFALLKL